jgi:hypothetical protein
MRICNTPPYLSNIFAHLLGPGRGLSSIWEVWEGFEKDMGRTLGRMWEDLWEGLAKDLARAWEEFWEGFGKRPGSVGKRLGSIWGGVHIL